MFDITLARHVWSGEPAGEYVWFALLTNPGADPANPANQLSFDTATVTKQ